METNGSNGAGHDGKAHVAAAVERSVPPAPDRVRDLADGCVRFVERALGVKLDYEPETLPVLDHWVAAARAEASSKPETAAVVAHAAGAYFGEVVRRRYPSWWRAEGDDPGAFRIELEPVYLSFSPVQLVVDALFHEEENESLEQLEIEDADREAVGARLAELPPVSEEEFFSLATRLEVIDIAVDAIRARRLGEGEGDAVLGPDDYEG
ncbi:MAG: hypothetical protein QM820_14720 [Minicystis sp.]